MIDKDYFMPLAFFKKEVFTGSEKGMRFLIRKADDKLEGIIWPEPYSFAATQEDLKSKAEFEFSQDGVGLAVDWLNAQYEENQERWEKSFRITNPPFPK